MWAPDLTHRSEALELMDDRAIGGEELAEALRDLRLVNRVLGAAWPTLEGVKRLWRAAGRPERLSVIDVGAGSGDINRRLLAWADHRRVDLRITLVDLHPETCVTAADYYRGEPRVRVVCADALRLCLRADVVTASLFAHHFPARELPRLLAAMTRAARLGVVINDLHRSRLAWIGIWIWTRLFSKNRMFRNDAPLSVQRGFRAADLDRLRADTDLRELTYAWRPLFRYLITVPGAAHS